MNHEKIELSVIIPARNEQIRLRSLLPYLSENAHDLVEVIVVDASDDEQDWAFAKYIPNLKIIECSVQSRAVQMNMGARMAAGNTLAFLHADVLPPRSFVELIREKIDSACDAGWFCYVFDRPGWWMRLNASTTRRLGIFSGGGDQFLFFSKTTFESLNGFDESYEIMEDFELTRRLKQAKYRIGLIQTPCVVSARKYDKNSWFRVNFVNGIAFLMFLAGIAPKSIKRFYRWALRPSDEARLHAAGEYEV